MSAAKNDVSLRHKKEWAEFRELYLKRCLSCEDAELAKAAKAIADVLKVYQEGERKAWDFSEHEEKTDELRISWQD